MMDFSRVLIALAVAASGLGCGDPADAPEVKPTLVSIQENIFTKSCANEACHGAKRQGGLDLRDGSSYNNLVNIDATRVPGMKRVAPGEPERSFLMVKLTGPSAGQGEPMPLGGKPLSTTQLDSIRAWIENGAQP